MAIKLRIASSYAYDTYWEAVVADWMPDDAGYVFTYCCSAALGFSVDALGTGLDFCTITTR